MADSLNPIADFSLTPIASFIATGKRRCAVPGVGCTNLGGYFGSTYSFADFWRGQSGGVLVRVSCMGYRWSFLAQRRSGEPIPNERKPMEDFGAFVMQELHRWMAQDAADLPPFEDDETEAPQDTSEKGCV